MVDAVPVKVGQERVLGGLVLGEYEHVRPVPISEAVALRVQSHNCVMRLGVVPLPLPRHPRQVHALHHAVGEVDALNTPAPGVERHRDNRLLRYYRNTPDAYGKRAHALLELAWFTGARQGGLRALDLRDVYLEDAYVEFHHRPETGTPLKNKEDGERPVALPETIMDVLERYIDRYRYDVHDEHNRAPLLASRYGRPTTGTIRDWAYIATQPCLHSACPHDRERETCEYTDPEHASKCPSSRSPHRIRTGSISWQLDIGLPPWVVAERVNAPVPVIEAHYDKTSPLERMERRRRPFIDQLELDFEDEQPTNQTSEETDS